MHTEGTRVKKKLSDYKPLPYTIPHIDLNFELDPANTIVTARYSLIKNQNAFHIESLYPLDIILNGKDCKLLQLKLNGEILKEESYILTNENLILPKTFQGNPIELEIITQISPETNSELTGLYISSGIFCTQNEPEGFRKITYFLDRPDVLSTYRVRIESSIDYKYRLSNGNLIEQGKTNQGNLYSIWEDPHPKPCYLFALVAGNLEKVTEFYTTRSGKKVQLDIYTNPGKANLTNFAMESLKLAMEWDEKVFHREYDLDLYMIVAVDDFNMGAMENKGLNIFNSKLVLSSPETATDSIFEDILSVVAHEYFHNWTGNRITLRDWFQLTLKEGLTVFRDQLFSQDMIGQVKRIDDIEYLRTYQFAEDQGKLSHPIQPEEYLDIDNFYTRTVYEKGAEVIRMLYTITGRDKFIEILDEYFLRYDGKAVTTNDFLQVFEDFGISLDTFKNWYKRKGTPIIQITEEYNPNLGTYTIKWEDKSYYETGIPLHFPVQYSLHNPIDKKQVQEGIFHWKGIQGEEIFTNQNSRPILALFQNLSAPILLNWNRPDEDLFYLWLNDRDPFIRYDSAMQIKLKNIQERISQPNIVPKNEEKLIHSYKEIFQNLPKDWQEIRFLSYLIRLPELVQVIHLQFTYKIQESYFAILELEKNLTKSLQEIFFSSFYWIQNELSKPLKNQLEQSSLRYFKNVLLYFLRFHEDFVYQEFKNAKNMTDTVATMKALSHTSSNLYEKVLEEFSRRWKDDSLVMDYWLSIQASSTRKDCFERVKFLKNSDYFDIHNPNRVIALLGNFTKNLIHFHREDGASYEWIMDTILELDSINPQSSSRIAKAFSDIHKLPNPLQEKARFVLLEIYNRKNISNLLYEVVESILN